MQTSKEFNVDLPCHAGIDSLGGQIPDHAGLMAPALRPRVLEPDGHDSAQQPSQQSGDATFSSSEDQHPNQ